MSTMPADVVHVRCAGVLAAANLDALSIKGPATAALLYTDSARVASDADVLVAAAAFADAHRALTAAGFVSLEQSLRADERTPHSDTLAHPDLGTTLDLHRSFPGIERDADEAFAVLWARRQSLVVDGGRIQITDPATTALFIALHAARNGYGTGLSSTDLRRVLHRLDDDLWRRTFALAEQLQATQALVAGLRFLPRGRDLSATFAPGVDAGRWLLHQAPDAAPARRWVRAQDLPLRARIRFLLGEVLPSPAFMRLDWPMARRGPLGLAVAHLQRWANLARRLPAVILAVRRIRHER